MIIYSSKMAKWLHLYNSNPSLSAGFHKTGQKNRARFYLIVLAI